MDEFSTALLREKIVFAEEGAQETVVKSNRILLQLGRNAAREKIVVRAQTMHVTLYLASRILYSYFRNGPFLERSAPYDWQGMWDSVLSDYEKRFNPNHWSCVYINGKSFFRTQTSPFVDIVEQCALLSADNYDETMGVTESVLKRLGKNIRVSHATNVAAVFTDSGDAMRCGLIHRENGRDTTLSFTAEGGERENRIYHSLSVAGELLEGMNLHFFVKRSRLQAARGDILKGGGASETVQVRGASSRLVTLNKNISTFEGIYAVKYRPEKPDFFSK